jgi:hypothetical protein
VSSALQDVTYSDSLGIFVAVGLSGTILYSETLPDNNIIDRLTSDSDMSFALALGENNVLLYNTPVDLRGTLTYRQRYVGV